VAGVRIAPGRTGVDGACERWNFAAAGFRVSNAEFVAAIANRIASPDTGRTYRRQGFANDRAAERAALRKHIVRHRDLHSTGCAGAHANHGTALVRIALQAQCVASSNRYYSDCF
jgi:hypothetical protein